MDARRLVVHGPYRIAQKAGARWLRRNYPRRIASPAPGASFAPLPVAPGSRSGLPAALASQTVALRCEADSALDHRFDLLGSGPTSLGAQIDWHRDFKSGASWPRAFYQDVQAVDLGNSADPKVAWDLSRGHQLLALGRAATVFEEPRYLHELERQLDSWVEANPPGIGINWVNPMEVAIRATNWAWALSAVGGPEVLAPRVADAVVRSLQSHGRHIAANLEGTPYLRSNHYLGDILGLLVLAAVLGGDPAAVSWERKARRAFEREIRRQVLDDGVGFEASLPYHGLALEIFLIACWLCSIRGRPLSATFGERLRQMLRVSLSVRHPNGRIPAFGDADDGRVLPASSARGPHQENLLWAGAALLETAAPTAGPPPAEVAWNFGVDAWLRAELSEASADHGCAAFSFGGVYVLRGHEAHAVVRCGDVGQNGNGGHAHNDLLSYELSLGRALVVVDPGTYVYTADPEARNAFRGTEAHSSVVVAGEEINPIAADQLFRLAQIATPQVSAWEVSAERALLVASHDGYRRLDQRVIHTRRFELDRHAGAFAVNDRLTGEGEIEARCSIHCAADVGLTRYGSRSVELETSSGVVTLEFSGPVSELIISEGWISERYGERRKAPLLTVALNGRLPLDFAHVLTPAQAA